ncbi:MAG: OmpA family protein [Gemmatimonadales bacterium]
MIRKLSVLCAAIALMATAPAHAQSKGTFLVDVGVALPWYPSYMGLSDKVGPGGRLGYMMSDKLGFEVDAFFLSTEPSSASYTGVNIDQTMGHARFTYNAPMGKGLAAIFGLGFAYNKWGGDAGTYFMRDSTSYDKDSDYGPGGLFGLRFGAGGKVSARVDLTADYIPSPIMADNPYTQNQFYWGMDAMLSIAFGGKPGTPKDSDKDGVPDKTDLCPNTPLGTAVDANGCPYGDADKDGVTDNLDKCPNTPMGATVDAAGCPSDSDKDSVYNGIDRCRTPRWVRRWTPRAARRTRTATACTTGSTSAPTPATRVDAKGCPVDSDGDGVPDYMDKCPNTPAGIKVNAEGCPILFEPGKTAVVLPGVNFASNSAVLDPSSQEILDKVANFMQYNPSGYKLEVAGYTSSTGSPRAQHAALAAACGSRREVPREQGCPDWHADGQGLRSGLPVDTNATAAGRANNRRVELKQIK